MKDVMDTILGWKMESIGYGIDAFQRYGRDFNLYNLALCMGLWS